MKSTNTQKNKWVYLPIVFCSTAVLSSQLLAGAQVAGQMVGSQQVSGSQQAYGSQQVSGSQQAYGGQQVSGGQEYQETNRLDYEYVGGSTRISVGVDTEFDGTAELSQVVAEDKDSATIADVWAGFDVSGDNKGIKAAGGRVSHHWVNRDSAGNADSVSKAFVAYDRNENDHDKATIGYGQENKDFFWEGYVGTSLSDKKLVGTTNDKKPVYEKAYDYNGGVNAGTHLTGTNMRVRGGVDYAWGEGGQGEDDAQKVTGTIGVDKYFKDTPHSVSLDVRASRAEGGYNSNTETQTNANLSYNYEFGRNGIYDNGKTTKRVRVEIPGVPGRPARVERKAIKTPYKVARQVAVGGKRVATGPAACNIVKTSVQLGCEYFFQDNSHVLLPAAQQRIRQIAHQMRRANHHGNIVITSHVCASQGKSCGGNQANHLAKRRAEMVKNLLVRFGFKANQIITRGIASNRNVVDIAYSGSNVQRQTCGYKTAYKTVYDTRYKTTYKNVVISPATAAIPASVTWKTEVVNTQPAWVTRALHSTISHNRHVDTYLSVDRTTSSSSGGNSTLSAGNDTEFTNVNQSVTIKVLNNDYGYTSINKIVKQPSNGTVSIVGSGVNQTIVYTPNQNYTGTDTFRYSIIDQYGYTKEADVTVTIGGSGTTTPIKAVDNAQAVQSEATTLINVLGNDTGNGIYVLSAGSASHGTVIVKNRQIYYTSNANYTGTDTFTYTIKDGAGQTATANVTVTVQGKTPTQGKTIANNDSANTWKNTTLSNINILGNDYDPEGDAMKVTYLSPATNGKVILNSDNTITYTPNTGYVGQEILSYQIADSNGNTSQATVTINVLNTK